MFNNLIVAVVGSRHGSNLPVAQVCYHLVGQHCQIVTGCAAGVDRQVRQAIPSAKVISAMSFVRRGLPVSAALAARTKAVISSSQAVCIFPPANGNLGSGSLLALQSALKQNIPVWVAGSKPPTQLGWQPFVLSGVSGWFFNCGLNSLF